MRTVTGLGLTGFTTRSWCGTRKDDHAATTVQSTAEHAVLAMVTAARAGARVPEPVLAYPVAARGGTRGALLAWVDVGGRALDGLEPEEIPDAALADLWHSVAVLHKHRLAHRQLSERTTSSSTTTNKRG